MNSLKSVSIIVPAYNETGNFKLGVLDELDQGLKSLDYDHEVIIIDDGSTDNTATLVGKYVKSKPRWRLVKARHGGKAKTVLHGFHLAQKNFILFTDFDQSTPISELAKLMDLAKDNHTIAIGSREMPNSKRISEPVLRHLMGRVFNTLVQALALPGIKDSQCGFKLFPQSANTEIIPQMKIYNNLVVADAFTGAFDVELLYIARKRGYQIKEVPVTWTHRQSNRVNPLKDSVRMFRDVLRLKLNGITGQYD